MAFVSRPFRLRFPLLRCVLAVLALVSQLTLGSIAPTARAEAADLMTLDSVSVLCGAPAGRLIAAPDTRRPHRREQPVAARHWTLELPAVVLAAAPIVPVARPVPGVLRARLPPPRAPPVPRTRVPQARAPPIPD